MNKVEEMKLALAAVWSCVAVMLGWKGLLALCWVVLMALDYITGSCAALRQGQWNSSRAREGIWHKGGALVVVLVAAIADGVMVVLCGNIPLVNIQWPQVMLPLVLAWYILTELGSILENAILLGAQPPAWLGAALAAGKKAVEEMGASDGGAE